MKQKRDPHEQVLKSLVDDMGKLLAHRLHNRFKPKQQPTPPTEAPKAEAESEDLSELESHYASIPESK